MHSESNSQDPSNCVKVPISTQDLKVSEVIVFSYSECELGGHAAAFRRHSEQAVSLQ